MSETSRPEPSRPSFAYLAGVLVRNVIRLSDLVREAAVEGWREAGSHSGSESSDTATGGGAAGAPSASRSAAPSEPLMLNSRAMQLAERAQALAGDDREDGAAVLELIEQSGGDTECLRESAVWFRESAWNLESRQADRAYRLLTAAIRHDGVRPISADAEERFRQLDELRAMPLPDAWDHLCSLEPRLVAVAGEARGGVLGRAVLLPAGEAGTTGSDPEAGLRWLDSEARLRDRLGAVVGPAAESDVWLVRTAVAYRVAADYVRQLRPE